MIAKVILGMLALAAVVPASTPIAEGRWIITNQMEEVLFDGQRDDSPFPRSKPVSVCLAAADAAKGPGLAFSDLSRCKVLKSNVSDGAFAFETECKATESEDTILTKAAGRFSAGSYTGTSTSVQRRDGVQIEMRSQVEAKHVSTC